MFRFFFFKQKTAYEIGVRLVGSEMCIRDRLNPHTLVLDEATSLLDPSAARHLERSLNAVLSGRTVVAIAHRLHTARDADRVAVMDDGRIVEIGPHDELVERGGEYAALWHSW